VSASSQATTASTSTITGWCARCGASHAIEHDGAKATAALWRALEERPALTAALTAQAPKMVGCLVGLDGDEEVVLLAISGDLGGVQDVDGCVPSVVRREHTAALETDTLAAIARHTTALEAATTEDARRAAKAVRRAASATLMAAMIDATVLVTRGQRLVPLREAFVGGGIPSGTADCALPKLLVEANRRALRIVGVDERLFSPGTPRHGEHVGPCARRCEPILGALLCTA